MARHHAEIGADLTALLKALGIFERQYEGQRGQSADAGNLSENLCLRVLLLAQALNLRVVFLDVLGDTLDLVEDRQESVTKLRHGLYLWTNSARESVSCAAR